MNNTQERRERELDRLFAKQKWSLRDAWNYTKADGWKPIAFATSFATASFALMFQYQPAISAASQTFNQYFCR